MRQSLMRSLAGAVIAAAALLAAVPGRAADTTTAAPAKLVVLQPQPPVDTHAWDDIRYERAPLGSRQIETDKVLRMARDLQQDFGASHAGEDALGTGTSITH
jgi:hypothetical protein